MIRRLAFLLLPSLVLAVAAGCGSSSSGNGGSGGSTGTAGSTGAGATTGGAFGMVTACMKADGKSCDTKSESTSKGIDDVNASCTANMGTVMAHCPAAGVVGCCTAYGVGGCYYDMASAASAMSACASPLTWGTTPP